VVPKTKTNSPITDAPQNMYILAGTYGSTMYSHYLETPANKNVLTKMGMAVHYNLRVLGRASAQMRFYKLHTIFFLSALLKPY
jgi:hypothetical protein